MFTKVEHIGVAVKDLAVSAQLFEKLFGVAAYKEEVVESEGVKTLFYRLGETKIELLQGIKEGNAISKFIEKKGEGIHHIAYDVADIYKEMERLKSEGFTLLSEQPKQGADNKLICFIHPKDTNSVLTEICQERAQ